MLPREEEERPLQDGRLYTALLYFGSITNHWEKECSVLVIYRFGLFLLDHSSTFKFQQTQSQELTPPTLL